MLLLQANPASVQVLCSQQRCPALPHATHMPLLQAAPATVHSPRQHAWPMPPQGIATVPHDPFVQVPPRLSQLLPLVMQTFVAPQHAPPEQEFPGQQARPPVPHGVQRPPAQVFPLWQELFGQQA